jgi:hypothetical protein
MSYPEKMNKPSGTGYSSHSFICQMRILISRQMKSAKIQRPIKCVGSYLMWTASSCYALKE